MKINILFVFLALSFFASSGQERYSLDSLRNVLQKEINSKESLDKHIDLAIKYSLINENEDANELIKSAFSISKDAIDSNRVWKAFAEVNSGVLDSDSIIKILRSVIKFAGSIKDSSIYHQANYTLADIYFEIGEFIQSKQLYDEVYQFFLRRNDSLMIRACWNNMARVYVVLGEEEMGVEYYFKALKEYEKAGSMANVAIILNNIGTVYLEEDEYEKSLIYLLRAIEIYNQNGLQKVSSMAISNAGIAYKNLKQLDSAIIFLERAARIDEESGNKSGLVSRLYNIGNCYLDMVNFDKALIYFERSLKLSQEMGILIGSYYNNYGIGITYIKMGKLELAEPRIDRASKILGELGSRPMEREFYNKLHESYKEANEYKLALKYLESYRSVVDSMDHMERLKATTDQELKYEYSRIENERVLLLSKQKEQEAMIKLQQYVGGTLLILFIAGMTMLISLSKINANARLVNEQLTDQKRISEEQNRELLALNNEIRFQKDELEESNAIKDKLFSIISHDLKGPLNTLRSLLNLAEKGAFSSKDLKNLITNIGSEVGKNTNLLENLLNWSRSQLQGLELNKAEISLSAIVDQNLDLLKHESERKKIRIESSIPESLKAFADKDMIMLVIRNIISNAIKYCKQDDVIYISALEQDHFVNVSIRDTGPGMSQDVQDSLFRLSTVIKSSIGDRGTGLGLVLCKEMIEKNGGAISVQSEMNAGSNFIFTIPTS